MVLMPEPVFAAVEAIEPPRPLYLLGPAGRPFDQELARALAASEGFSLLCGRYEGVDDRIRTHLCDDELSIGDYVLAGGEVAACVVIEAVGRLLPGVMGNAQSAIDESFSQGWLEHPQFTRPAEFRGLAVPEVLRSGDHARVARWRGPGALVPRTSAIWCGRGGLAPLTRLCWTIRANHLSFPSPPTMPHRSFARHEEHRFHRQREPPRRRPVFGAGDNVKVHVPSSRASRAAAGVPGQRHPAQRSGSTRRSPCAKSVSGSASSARPRALADHRETRAHARGTFAGKLYYLRDRSGRSAKIREKREN